MDVSLNELHRASLQICYGALYRFFFLDKRGKNHLRAHFSAYHVNVLVNVNVNVPEYETLFLPA